MAFLTILLTVIQFGILFYLFFKVRKFDDKFAQQLEQQKAVKALLEQLNQKKD
ncbi:hypothetical protein NC661_11295 [Aquibacillus koreensis]|uniref:Uncharacterized protein n=1 Tax=Aquibacillus koreensis TaxID=279446 RepID=A0A9X4AIP6_9BACI|nr:hypothetical protein [Aquibacillus koreensis]MCT2537699.1 hypothetical protein [Aquibacillus koreensis]MDC3420954.1 hypothetical protein [Aquibacillus koreensis]